MSDPLTSAAGKRKRRRRSLGNRRSPQHGISSSARAQWTQRKKKAGVSGLSLGKDPNGYYAYKGSVRTKSYNLVSRIPISTLRYIELAR